MALEFQPKTEKQLQEESLASEGEYDFEVLSAQDTKSKKGNDMIAVKLGLYSGDAIRHHVYDYLLPTMGHKLRHFCDATGLLAKYEAGSLCAEDCQGRAGRVKIKVEQDKDGKYPPKNVVDDYVIRAPKSVGKKAEPQKPEPNDDVPF